MSTLEEDVVSGTNLQTLKEKDEELRTETERVRDGVDLVI
jgi:hypothetical protein